MMRNNSAEAWMNINHNINMNPHHAAAAAANGAMNMNQQQQHQHQQVQQAAVSAQQPMGSGLNPVAMTAQQQHQLQQHQKIQMMQLHQRLKQQRGGPSGADRINADSAMQQQAQQPQPQQQQQHGSWNAHQQAMQQGQSNVPGPGVQSNMQNRNAMLQQQQAQQAQQMGSAPVAVAGQQQQPSQQQQMMQFQMQQQQMKQLQMQQAQQPQAGQMMQQPQQQTHNQMMQQQQALEEQKRRYSQQLQQLQNQQNLHAQQQQINRPASASGHQSLQQQVQQQQQQQQHYPMSRSTSISSQQQGTRRPSYRMNAGTPLSPSPSAMRPSSTQPIRPPSRPSSQFSQGSAQLFSSSHNRQVQQTFPVGQANADPGGEFPPNTFYNPVSTSAKSNNKSSLARPGGESASTQQQHVAFDTSTFSQPALPNALSQPPQLATASASSTTEGAQSATNPAQASATASSSAGGKGGKKKSPQRRHSQLQHTSNLTYEEVANLANACTTEQKIVWVARQVLGAGGSNGFQKATSTMQRIKRQRARSFKHKEGVSTKDGSDSEEKLKSDTFTARVAKRMQVEMKEGLQFCNLMTDVIRNILEDIDPDNPVLSVQPPMIGLDGEAEPDSGLLSIPPPSVPTAPVVDASAGTTGSAAGTPRNNISGGGGNLLTSSSSILDATKGKKSRVNVPLSPSAARKEKRSSVNVPLSPSAARRASSGAESASEGSTLRKLKKRGSNAMPVADLELLKMVGEHDENGKKLSKKELSYRLFEGTRFRTLKVGDYVAAKMASHDLWILARVAKQWNAVATYKQLAGLTEAKRDGLIGSHGSVYLQDNDEFDEFNGDIESARAIGRQHVLPLPRSFGEASDWGTRVRKGSRVYAMYPNTTALYCGSVIDSNTFCRNQDDIIVVQFDGDEDDDGVVPPRHIPARFVTLIPREFPASARAKKRKSATTSDGARKRGSVSKNLPPIASAPANASAKESSVDEMLRGMFGDSGSSTLKNIDFGDMQFSSTPRSTPPPSSQTQTKRSRGGKKQKGDELASSHF